MRIEGPTNPFHVARTYAVQPPLRLTRAEPIAPVASRPDAAPARPPSNADRLVAAHVPGRVDFSGESPRPADPAAIPMYRRPSERNAAATSIAVSRSLDVVG